MIEHVGNLAALEGHVIIVHGVNGGWGHGPKFDEGFAGARAIHMPRIGCDLGGLDWESQVRSAVETAERIRNEILPGASGSYSETVTRWPAEFNVWTTAPAERGE